MGGAVHRLHPIECINQMVFESQFPKRYHLIVEISNSKTKVDGFVGELTF